jgi:ribose 5-phosphate isomerase B
VSLKKLDNGEKMKIIIGSDHAGYDLRLAVIEKLRNENYEVIDCGTSNPNSSNYAVEGIKVGENVAQDKNAMGIVICGSGIGISIAVNKVRGIRCALVGTPELAVLSRQHNDANVIALGARFIDQECAFECIEKFISTDFEGGRHEDRVDTIHDYEMCCVDC